MEKTGIELIAEERQRQIEEEGFTPEADSYNYVDNQLAIAACCYAYPNYDTDWHIQNEIVWPWDASWWKPSPEDRVRELQKAGALIAAEIDRLNNQKI